MLAMMSNEMQSGCEKLTEGEVVRTCGAKVD